MPKKGSRVTTADFALLEGAKARHAAHVFALCVDTKKDTPAKFSVIVSKKVAKNAVARNRIKRRIREIIKKEIAPTLPAGTLLVVHAKKGIEELSVDEIFAELKTVV